MALWRYALYHQSAITSRRSYANYTGWKFHGGYISSWPLWCTNVFMAWHRHTSLTNFITQQSRSFEGVCVPLRRTNCFFPVPDSQPIRRLSISSRRCVDLEQSSTAYHICSVISRLLFSFEDTLLRTLLPVITVVVRLVPRSDTVIYGHFNRSYLIWATVLTIQFSTFVVQRLQTFANNFVTNAFINVVILYLKGRDLVLGWRCAKPVFDAKGI